MNIHSLSLKTYALVVLGCQMNKADSEKIDHIFMAQGLNKRDPLIADIVIVVTCSVRERGENRMFGIIRDLKAKAKKSGKNVLIGITGCMIRKTGIRWSERSDKKRPDTVNLLPYREAARNSDDRLFLRSAHIDFVFRIEESSYLPFLISELTQTVIEKSTENEDDSYLSLKQIRSNPTVANIIIQTGCDNFCTYCIVPQARGREYSRDQNAIVEEIKTVINQGYKEILLIGQNVNSYGKEQHLKTWNNETMTWQSSEVKTPFRELLNAIDAIDGIARLRFTSSNPHDMTQDILDVHFELPSICHHLHIALQSGDNILLKAMNRRHTVEDFEHIVTYLRSRDPLFSITTDIIVGFPGETEEQFENTIRAYRACQFDFAYIAQYSERKGTFAAEHLPDNVSKETKLRRWHLLNDLLAETALERNRLMIGREETILVSAYDPTLGYSGRTRNFKEVFIDKKKNINIGDFVDVTIIEAENWFLKGKARIEESTQ